MRCKVKGCLITTRQANAYKCWRELNMCPMHAMKSHPEMYNHVPHLLARKTGYRKVGVRGRNHRFND